jgi:hypothetical protein
VSGWGDFSRDVAGGNLRHLNEADERRVALSSGRVIAFLLATTLLGLVGLGEMLVQELGQ